jgi:hypothetical protein
VTTKRLHPTACATVRPYTCSGLASTWSPISQWLGHASVTTTTNLYPTVDVEMKRKAIEQGRPIGQAGPDVALWRADASILKWLEEL